MSEFDQLLRLDVPVETTFMQAKWAVDRLYPQQETLYDPVLYVVKRAKDATYPFTVAVDLDGTLAKKEEPFSSETIGEPIPGAIAWVKKFHDAGARIIIFTVRSTSKTLKDWLKTNKVPYDYINENPDQPAGSSGKVLADVYYDDRAVDATDHSKSGPEVLGRINANVLTSTLTQQSDVTKDQN